MAERYIAVVIVTYKSARLTIEGLRSLAAERIASGLDIRAFVVDNASGDLPAVAAAVQQERWSDWAFPILAPKNGGFAYGNNLGIVCAYEQGKPDYVYLLNPDAEVRPGGVATLARFLDQHPEAGIAGSSFENPDGSDWPIAFRFPSLFSELSEGLEVGAVSALLHPWVVARTMPKVAQPTDWICGASMMIRPAVFAAIGGLDENYFLYFEETDFCYRAKQAGFPTWYVPESRVMHIAGQSTAVTDPTLAPRRLPAYWFESRRRYFAVTFGVGRAIVIDLVAVVAHLFGSVKRTLLRRKTVPHYIRDLIRYSVLWPRNRQFPATRSGLTDTVRP
jgi:N-acetylglucosaminyl-diphospho-decaprenol L-rhamnosyltransferase